MLMNFCYFRLLSGSYNRGVLQYLRLVEAAVYCPVAHTLSLAFSLSPFLHSAGLNGNRCMRRVPTSCFNSSPTLTLRRPKLRDAALKTTTLLLHRRLRLLLLLLLMFSSSAPSSFFSSLLLLVLLLRRHRRQRRRRARTRSPFTFFSVLPFLFFLHPAPTCPPLATAASCVHQQHAARHARTHGALVAPTRTLVCIQRRLSFFFIL